MNLCEINTDCFQTARKLQIMSLMIRPVPSGITLTSYRSTKHRLKRNLSINKTFRRKNLQINKNCASILKFEEIRWDSSLHKLFSIYRVRHMCKCLILKRKKTTPILTFELHNKLFTARRKKTFGVNTGEEKRNQSAIEDWWKNWYLV